MKKCIVALFLCVLLTTLTARAEAQPDYRFTRSFQIRSGYVEYRLSGAIGGSKSFWWDGYGERYREEISLDGRKSSLSVADGRYFYTVNLRTMQGTKVRADVAAQVQSHFDGGRPPEARGSETILGRLCERTESEGAAVSSYKGVPLRVDEFGIVEEAVLFEENIPADDALFAPPADVRFEDATEDLRSEPLSKEGGGEYDHADDVPYPEGVAFEKFVSECRFVAGNMAFRPTLEHASFGMYSSYWESEEGGFLAFDMQALAINLDWPVIHGENAEMFEHAGQKMAFYKDIFYDEEEGTSSPASILIVEMKEEDALLQISISPERTKAEMTAIIDELKF